MSDFMTSAESPAVGVGPAGKAAASSIGSGNGSWGVAGEMDQITVVRIDDTHIAEEHSHDGGKGNAATAACYEMEYSVPEEEEEEEDGVYVIEYSNPEEEGESYQFTMSVDRSLPAKKPADKQPAAPESAKAPSPTSKLSGRPRQNRKRLAEEVEVRKEEQQQLVSNKCILELGEDYGAAAGATSGSGEQRLVCPLCPPPGRSFQRASGLAVHMKHMHLLEGNKTFFCTMCTQPVRSQVELDAHTKRHANRRAVFTCLLCPAAPGYQGPRLGLKRHLMQEHPGVVPRCDVCCKGFPSLASYLADQFRHVGVSPYFCTKCQIYEMTERGLSVHIRNHDNKKKKKTQHEQQQEQQQQDEQQQQQQEQQDEKQHEQQDEEQHEQQDEEQHEQQQQDEEQHEQQQQDEEQQQQHEEQQDEEQQQEHEKQLQDEQHKLQHEQQQELLHELQHEQVQQLQELQQEKLRHQLLLHQVQQLQDEEKRLQEKQLLQQKLLKQLLQQDEQQQQQLQELGGNGPQALGGVDNADNSATDDSDF